jgi:calcineurin-like phosphoesterase family protein
MGNHENQYGKFRTRELFDVFNKVYGLHTRKGCWLSHAPIHAEELRNKFNVHGHTHNFNINDYRYANVSVENCNYYPVDFQEIKKAFINKTIFTKE